MGCSRHVPSPVFTRHVFLDELCLWLLQLVEASRFFFFAKVCTSQLEESCTLSGWISTETTDNSLLIISRTRPDPANPGQYIIEYTATAAVLGAEETVRYLLIEIRYGSSESIAVPIRGPTDVESANGELLR